MFDSQYGTEAETGARHIVDDISSAEKPGRNLEDTINDIVAQAGGWSEAIAAAILRLLEAALKTGAPMGAAMRDAYNRSVAAAETLTSFAREHPVFCTVVALGVLAILAPAVISALGFTAEGVMEGSFAAAWQSTYGGFVEAGSWFAYFQKLGTLVG